VEKLEKYEEEEITKLNKKNMNNAYAESRKRGILFQAEQRVCSLYHLMSKLIHLAINNLITIPFSFESLRKGGHLQPREHWVVIHHKFHQSVSSDWKNLL